MLEDSGDDPKSNYPKSLEDLLEVTSEITGFSTIQHEQTKWGLSYFCWSRKVQQDGTHIRHIKK